MVVFGGARTPSGFSGPMIRSFATDRGTTPDPGSRVSFSACSAQIYGIDFGAPVARGREPAQQMICIDARRRPRSARILDGPLDPATDIRKDFTRIHSVGDSHGPPGSLP